MTNWQDRDIPISRRRYPVLTAADLDRFYRASVAQAPHTVVTAYCGCDIERCDEHHADLIRQLSLYRSHTWPIAPITTL